MNKIIAALDKATHKIMVETFGEDVDKAEEFERNNPDVFICWINTPTFEKAQAAFEHSKFQGKNQPITHPLD
jgi:hypothetical protein